MRFLSLGVVALLVFPLSAAACLNDSEGVSTEREFRSSYEIHPPATAPNQSQDALPYDDSSALSSRREWNWTGIGVAILGLALIGGAVQITRTKHSR